MLLNDYSALSREELIEMLHSRDIQLMRDEAVAASREFDLRREAVASENMSAVISNWSLDDLASVTLGAM